jgi:hypothetical protein
MSAAEKFVANPPGRMESHSSRRALARPFCALQELDPEIHAMCDPLLEEEARRLTRSDPQTYRLHVEFVQAHGIPKGRITTFSNTCAVTGPTGGSNGRNGARSK